eukprot:403376027
MLQIHNKLLTKNNLLGLNFLTYTQISQKWSKFKHNGIKLKKKHIQREANVLEH